MKTSPESGMRIRLRRARADDCARIFEWRNLPEIIERGLNRSKLIWEDHCQWFSKVHQSEGHLLLIILGNEEPLGQIRFDLQDRESARVSIYLHPKFTGKGLGVTALLAGGRAAFRHWPTLERIEALIRGDNPISARAFAKAGYEVVPRLTQSGHVQVRLWRPPLIPHNRLTVTESDVQTVAAAVRSGYWTGGPKIAALEQAFARAVEVQHGVAVGSGFAALRLGLHALGVREGDKVLIPAYCCVALCNAVLSLGASPVPSDVGPDGTLDLESCSQACASHHPKAIIAIHTFGVPAPIKALQRLGVPVIEDCAHGFGRSSGGARFGGQAQVTIVSLHATKLIGAGEGGLLLCDDAGLAERVRVARDCADLPPSPLRMNDRLSDLEAALAISQLARLPEFLRERERHADRYHERLAHHPGLTVPAPRERIWYRYVVATQFPCETMVRRLRAGGVAADQPWPEWRADGYRPLPTPQADAAYHSLVSLPLYPTLKEAEQDRVVTELIDALTASEEEL